jgi:23S rRNA (uridine2552-2'-O)-methyltransferase
MAVPPRRQGARQTLKSHKRRTASSRKWLERQINDPYVAAAKREGYRSRAAYKLAEIDARHRLLAPGRRVVDLGAAPGGWTQVAVSRARAVEGRGQVIAVDILPMEAVAGATVLQLDFLDPDAPAKLRDLLREGQADVVLSDMAAPTTGHARTDHLRIMALVEAAAAFAQDVLAPGGSFLAKVFQGGAERALLAELKRGFDSVRHIKPPASRAESAEVYLLGTGFRAAQS